MATAKAVQENRKVRVQLNQLKPNPRRDFIIDPIDPVAVAVAERCRKIATPRLIKVL